MAGTATQPAGTTEPTRRDFIVVAAGAFAAVGAAAAVWPFIHQMNPSADVLALSSTEVDLSQIAAGQSVTILWRGKPVFVRHRTAAEIAQAEKDDTAALPDPAKDADRVKKPEWLVMMGVCTHLGCVPLGQQGDFGGWFCPCHGSHYDTSGRIRKGPAPANLPIPEYAFLNDTRIRIG
ncbi:MAG: ubiquinol-cytochrome c reductase iron-sulfur subunit [Ferrovibrio sp.]|uniref:ubiquinol-cytochrome c reductase iron-sulfur subunit n=1 Tax=Ferrovibrio sp. TaxID=1917215 RepID=UPI002609CBBB|nr:ubiquinol-cytochrome c reductase iron-sulfur subunit [Ferrovibrio sp.]MCW0236622.1 ubiquinol-cytochrome c reductase iron-sulfur subunit [Ferrovibrio sp.]